MLNNTIIAQLDELASTFEDRGEIKHAVSVDEINSLLVVTNTDIPDHVNKLTDLLCKHLKIDPEEALAVSTDLVEKYGLNERDLLNMGDIEVEGEMGFPTHIFPTGALPQKERRQGPDAALMNSNNPAWWEPREGSLNSVVKVVHDLEQYSDKLKQAGYKYQAKNIGLLVSKIMLNLEHKVNNSVKNVNIKKGMVLNDTVKNLFGTVEDIYIDNDVKVTVKDEKTGSVGGITLDKKDEVIVIKVSKPLQREALYKKANLLLEDLASKLEGHELLPQLERIRYNLEN